MAAWRISSKRVEGASASAGEPPAKKASVADARARVQASKAKAGASAAAPRADYELLLKGFTQMENRLRQVEGILFDQCFMKQTALPAAQGLKAAADYAAAVQGTPCHSHGPPHVHVAAGVLDGLVEQGVAEAADAGLKQRYVAVMVLRLLLNSMDIDMVAQCIRGFRVAPMYQKQGEEPKVRIIFHVQGAMRLPKASDLAEIEAQLKQPTAETFLKTLGSQLVDVVDGVPEAAGEAKGSPVQKLLLPLLCQTGGQRTSGKAPRGAIAYKLSRRTAEGGEEEDERL